MLESIVALLFGYFVVYLSFFALFMCFLLFILSLALPIWLFGKALCSDPVEIFFFSQPSNLFISKHHLMARFSGSPRRGLGTS